jgi:hypothetical protein
MLPRLLKKIETELANEKTEVVPSSTGRTNPQAAQVAPDQLARRD